MPALTHMQTAITTQRLWRHHLNQKTCGDITLQKNMAAYAHQ